MPFKAMYLTDKQVDSGYRNRLENTEFNELMAYLNRLCDPMAGDEMASFARTRESIAEDWEQTKRLRGDPVSEPDGEVIHAGDCF